MTSGELTNRVALVTGASAGLGRRFAKILAADGARVAIAARRLDRLQTLATEITAAGGTALPIEMDVASVASIRAAAATIESTLGPIEILVNNAGISRPARLEAVEEQDYDAVLDTNLKGAFFTAQAAARQMIAHKIEGRIVNIASVAGLRAVGQLGPYGMSKAAIIQMTHAMAREWGRHGINTNAICPGYITTEMAEAELETDHFKRFVASLPRKRMGDPGDLDSLLRLLCGGTSARFLNGAIIAADDGFTSF